MRKEACTGLHHYRATRPLRHPPSLVYLGTLIVFHLFGPLLHYMN